MFKRFIAKAGDKFWNIMQCTIIGVEMITLACIVVLDLVGLIPK